MSFKPDFQCEIFKNFGLVFLTDINTEILIIVVKQFVSFQTDDKNEKKSGDTNFFGLDINADILQLYL